MCVCIYIYIYIQSLHWRPLRELCLSGPSRDLGPARVRDIITIIIIIMIMITLITITIIILIKITNSNYNHNRVYQTTISYHTSYTISFKAWIPSLEKPGLPRPRDRRRAPLTRIIIFIVNMYILYIHVCIYIYAYCVLLI